MKDKTTSHYGEYSSSPDLNRFCREDGLNSSYSRGYFLHLLTDDLFYNKFLDVFSDEIYSDYNKLNRQIIEKYNIQIPENIKDLVGLEEGETEILKIESLCQFIDSVGSIDLENYKEKLNEDKGQEIE